MVNEGLTAKGQGGRAERLVAARRKLHAIYADPPWSSKSSGKASNGTPNQDLFSSLGEGVQGFITEDWPSKPNDREATRRLRTGFSAPA